MSLHGEMALEVARNIRDKVITGVSPWSRQYGSSISITSSRFQYIEKKR